MNNSSLCGFDNALSFKRIDNDDINYVEQYIQKKLLAAFVNDKGEPQNLADEDKIHFFGKYACRPQQFEFERGERKLILELVEHVKRTVDSDNITNKGMDHFSVNHN